ncbi:MULTISPECIES: RdgB/HAM1 family non-canonical purine NTP pyrophosphatase [Thiorhodovibrio]|uniref:RdgB/HAM1 family non-canonical purine NTP pyrophosphatase n=1 Tax=Thiorhodovibrio TaxID=61593 RepID=UPI001912F4FD|nr:MULTISPECIES: RdgB/HAM1 family non-canonical purine NTP pyrophosphatase [Thiorhodovibrio]MBK5968758.1 non-canonical purine NTP pyrophosphatase, RdgB/HAM1 family [Thiorhodovibrio winogradskyi]WPL10886.1 dITP/XTP pyrophosphatase [Thiorhodovibrio litoralis]
MTEHQHAVVLASNNAGKLRELEQLLQPADVRLYAQQEFSIASVEETGLTFVENAILKARHAAAGSGLPAIADDSGLEVDALNGAPGIRSARYAGEQADDGANCAKLLEAMTDIPQGHRQARFQCLVVYLRHAEDPTPVICQGTWEGRILTEPRGDKGFGYDPLFWVPGQNRSAAELDAGTKNALSHRGQALSKLVLALTDGLA